jgi:2'-5' RNA ligase
MKVLVFCLFLVSQSSGADLQQKMPFSSQFIEDGALIRNINLKSVQDLVPLIKKKYPKINNLQNRGEAHITVITPPEAQGWFNKDKKGINFLISPIELHKKYFSTIQKTKFTAKCIGKQTNEKGNIVFFIVVESKDIFNIRYEIQKEVESRAEFTGKKVSFNAENYYPHITIGYVGGDVHGVSKGLDTCVIDL